MAVNTQKLLPSAKGGSLVKTNKISLSNIVKKSPSISFGALKKSSVSIISETSQKNLGIIKVKVIEVDKLLKGTLASDKKKLDDKKKQDSTKRREDTETKLETKPSIKKGKIEIPKFPRMGFLDWIKNYIGNIILGYFVVRLIDHLPKIIPIVRLIGKATDFVLNLGGKLLDGLVTFIDWGYKAYDATRGFVKNLFGESGAKEFDRLSSVLNQFLNLAIIAGMVAAGSGGGFGGKGTGGKGGIGLKPGQGGRPKVTTSGGGAAGRPNLRNPLRQRPTVTTGGKPQLRLPGTGPKVTVGGGPKGLLRSVRPFLKNIRVPVIGALIDFGLSVALGENPGRAAFRAIGAGLLSYIGAGLAGAAGLVTGPGAVAAAALGSIGGGILGDMAGGALYDVFFGGKQPKGKKGYAGGGSTRGGKRQGSVTRTISKSKKGKYKRKLPKKPDEIEISSPGSDVGGEDKLFGLFPNPLKTAKEAVDMMNPFKVIQNTGKNLGKSDYFGPILAITSKILLGQKPTRKDYKNVGLGINLLLARGVEDGKILGGLAAAFEEGGFVDPKALDAISQGGDISDWVASSFKEATETNAQKTLREIQENLRLKQPTEKEMESEKGLKQADPNLDVGPGGVVTGGNADFWTLVAISRMEDSDPQGSADVAQSIYNRVASGIYGGKTIKEIVLRQGQYEPTWKYPKRGRTGVPNPEWHSIKDLATASIATGISQADLQRTAAALRNSKYQEEAARFVGGRTDFMGGSNQPGPGDVRRKENAPNNFFGWFVGPAAVAYGKKNPGPAKAPQLGNIVVMGGGTSTTLGTGRISSVDSFTPIARKFGLTLTSSFRSGDPGYHGKNRARDYSNDAVGRGTPQQLAFAKHLVQNYGSSLTQLIYTPLGYGIANKKKVPLNYWGDATNRQHYHHVHVALKDGGMITEPTTAIIGEGGKPEAVIGEKNTERIEQMAPGLLPAIVGAETKDKLINTLKSINNYGFGPEDEIVIDANQFLGNMGDSSYSSSTGEGALLMSSYEEDPFEILYMGG